MNSMSALDTARNRFTAKVYDKSRPVTDEEWSEIQEILRLSPTSVNYQHVTYYTADTQEELDALAETALDFNKTRTSGASRAVVFAVPFGPSEEHLQAVLEQEIKDGRYPGKENDGSLDAGRRYFTGVNARSTSAFLDWASRQAYLDAGFITFAVAEMGIDATIMEGFDFAKLDAKLGLNAKGLASVLVLSFGRHDEKEDRNTIAIKPKSRLAHNIMFRRVKDAVK